MTITITEAIRQEHLDVEELFSEYENNSSFELALKICNELESHAMREEVHGYPSFCSAAPDLTEHSYEEHNKIRDLIVMVRQADDEDKQKTIVSLLKDAVMHHVEEEEAEILPAVEQALDESKLMELGAAFVGDKQ